MITAVLSVYHMGQYLAKAVDSLLAQTIRDYEILIIDDGSTAEDAAECDRLARESDRIRVFHKENGGLSSARNCGIEHAKGEYIIFPDPDDWVEPDYLERLLENLKEQDADLSICGHYVTKNGTDRLWNPTADKRLLGREEALDQLMLFDSYCGYAWNKLYRMDLIRSQQLLFDEELGMIQDLHFAVRYIALCHRVVYDPAPLYHYCRDNGGAALLKNRLTERQFSGIRSYEKIAELTAGSFPTVSDAAYGSMCEYVLRLIDAYLHSGMKEPEKLRFLCGKLRTYRRYYLADQRFTLKHRCSGALAADFPGLYSLLIRLFGHMRPSEMKKRGSRVGEVR